MTKRIDPVEFAYLWNEGVAFDRLLEWFNRSRSSILGAASSFRAKGYELRERKEENGDRNKIYTPSPEEIRIECLKIRKKRTLEMKDKPYSSEFDYPSLPKRIANIPPELRPRRKLSKHDGSG